MDEKHELLSVNVVGGEDDWHGPFMTVPREQVPKTFTLYGAVRTREAYRIGACLRVPCDASFQSQDRMDAWDLRQTWEGALADVVSRSHFHGTEPLRDVTMVRWTLGPVAWHHLTTLGVLSREVRGDRKNLGGWELKCDIPWVMSDAEGAVLAWCDMEPLHVEA